MASYRCTGCGLGECNVGVSTDEMDPVKFMANFKCTVWGPECTDLELEDPEGHHRDKNTGIPLGTKDGACVIDWQPCDKPEICDDCKKCKKVLDLQRGGIFDLVIGQEVWYICDDSIEELVTENGGRPHFNDQTSMVLHRGHVVDIDGENVTVTVEPYRKEPKGRAEMRAKGCAPTEIVCKGKDLYPFASGAIDSYLTAVRKNMEKQHCWFMEQDEKAEKAPETAL